MKEPIIGASQFELCFMELKDHLIKEEAINPNRMKIHWMNMAKDPRRI